MLPDFPALKEKILKQTNKHLRELSRNDPILSKIKVSRHFEGNTMITETEDGEKDVSEYKELSGKVSIDVGDIIEKGPSILIEHAQKFAEDMKRQQSELLFSKINEITEKTGNVISARGKPFAHDMFIEMIKKMWIDFDEEGSPSMPTLVVSPVLGAKLRNIFPEWENNEEYKKQFDEVIVQKRKEWDDRESNRKLVD